MNDLDADLVVVEETSVLVTDDAEILVETEIETVLISEGIEGPEGREPLDSRLIALITPLIPEAIPGDNGREVQIQKSATHIQWRYVGDASWTNIVALADLEGTDGYTPQKNVDYFDGTDGKNTEIRVSGGFIQWRLVGDGWTNLIAVADLIGAPGYTPLKNVDYFDGTNGKSAELQKTATHLQWRLVGDATWQNLVLLDDIKGADGADAPQQVFIGQSEPLTNATAIWFVTDSNGVIQDMAIQAGS